MSSISSLHLSFIFLLPHPSGVNRNGNTSSYIVAPVVIWSDNFRDKLSLQFPKYVNNYNSSNGKKNGYYFQFRVLIYSFSVSISKTKTNYTPDIYTWDRSETTGNPEHHLKQYGWFLPRTWNSYNHKINWSTWSGNWFLWPRAGRESIYHLHEEESAAIWKAL